jgi:3-(3-hydroxy-phenyl)propionate hydroxylase
VTVVGDRTGELKAWFDRHSESVLFLRPDRCIAAACIAQRAPEVSARLFDVLALTAQGGDRPDGPGPVLHVPQPTAESAGTTP